MSDSVAAPAAPATSGNSSGAPAFGRWWQLILGVICMSMIANLQYGWTLFVNPISEKHGWSRPAIQVAFTVFVVIETWLVPLEGYLVDKIGPMMVAVVSGVLVAASWVINSYADSLSMLYLGAAVGGIGAGGVYGSCVGNALKWFPDRRGLAAGITAMGFGAGSALTVVPIANMIRDAGYSETFFRFGILQGAVVVIVGFFLKAPPASFKAPANIGSTKGISTREYTPVEMLKTSPFYVMYLMFVLMAVGGMIATAQLTPIAKDFGIDKSPVALLGITLPALTFALSIDRILNGISRPFFGWVSDKIGRENTMFIAFATESAAILLLSKFGANPTAFVLLTSLVFFAYGEIYSLFPATCADSYGKKFASANSGLLYTAKGMAALLVPLSSKLGETAGGWHTVFYVAAGMNLTASVLAIVALKPLRTRLAAKSIAAAAN